MDFPGNTREGGEFLYGTCPPIRALSDVGFEPRLANETEDYGQRKRLGIGERSQGGLGGGLTFKKLASRR